MFEYIELFYNRKRMHSYYTAVIFFSLKKKLVKITIVSVRPVVFYSHGLSPNR